MDFPIDHPGFVGRGLTVRTAGFFGGPKLLVDGQPAAGKRGVFVLRSSGGEDVEIRLSSNHFDPVPKLSIGGSAVELARPLRWYEYAWMGLPLVLVLEGGAMGALIGMAAIYLSARVFRGGMGGLAKYAATGAISLAAVAAFLFAALAIQLAIHGAPRG